MDRDAFIARFGGIYENSPWVAAGAWDHGVDATDIDRVGHVMHMVVEFSDRSFRLDLLRAHPDLAGKLAVAGDLTDASRTEQAGAGLDRLTRAEFDEFQRLNTAYVARHGFPFIYAVRGAGKHAILEAFRTRLDKPTDIEFEAAMQQVHRIAAFRLAALKEQT